MGACRHRRDRKRRGDSNFSGDMKGELPPNENDICLEYGK